MLKCCLTPHTTPRVFLGPAPPPSSKHSRLILGRNATSRGEVCKKLKRKWEQGERTRVYPRKVGLSLRTKTTLEPRADGSHLEGDPGTKPNRGMLHTKPPQKQQQP